MSRILNFIFEISIFLVKMNRINWVIIFLEFFFTRLSPKDFRLSLKQVSFVRVVREFPRTASNKLMRRVLRDQVKKDLRIHSKM